MKNNSLRAFLLIICVFLCITYSAACTAEKNDNVNGSEKESEEIFEPAVPDKESELSKRHEEYGQNASLAFTMYEPMDKSCFEYETVNGAVRITKYIGLEDIVIVPDKIDGKAVREIAKSVFSGEVRAVYLPDSIEAIAHGAFENCTALSTLRLPFVGDGDENGYIGYIFGADEPMENAVKVPQSLDMVIVGDGCSEIEDEAFRGCKYLSAVILGDGEKSVGDFAFYQCTDLVYISLGRMVGEIGEYAFAYCTSLYFADVSAAEEIEKGAFYSCSRLDGIKLCLEGSEFLGWLFGADSADYNDEFVPLSLRRVIISEDCRKIPDRAFTACKYITEVTLPDGLETIGVRAFYACRSLSEISIPDGVKKIEDDAFFGCDNLVNVKLGDALETIGMQAFLGCAKLKSLEFPNSLYSIGSMAFYGCESLSSVSLGGVKKLGKDAFGGCQRLTPLDLDGIEVEK